ncbi:PilZ domain-containing protein [Methylorubrum suomiense]
MPDHLSQDAPHPSMAEHASEVNADPKGLVQRRETRTSTNWIAMIRLFDGTEIPCNVKDISKSGAKLGVPSSWDLPSAFMLKILGRDFVMRVTLAWRRGNYAGVHIDRIAKLPPAVETTAPVETTKPDYSSIGTRSRRFLGE